MPRWWIDIEYHTIPYHTIITSASELKEWTWAIDKGIEYLKTQTTQQEFKVPPPRPPPPAYVNTIQYRTIPSLLYNAELGSERLVFYWSERRWKRTGARSGLSSMTAQSRRTPRKALLYGIVWYCMVSFSPIHINLVTARGDDWHYSADWPYIRVQGMVHTIQRHPILSHSTCTIFLTGHLPNHATYIQFYQLLGQYHAIPYQTYRTIYSIQTWLFI